MKKNILLSILFLIVEMTTSIKCSEVKPQSKFQDYPFDISLFIEQRNKRTLEAFNPNLYPFDIDTISGLLQPELDSSYTQEVLDNLLFKAAFYNKSSLCRVLINHGANPNFSYVWSDKTSTTAKDIAAKHGHTIILNLLTAQDHFREQDSEQEENEE